MKASLLCIIVHVSDQQSVDGRILKAKLYLFSRPTGDLPGSNLTPTAP